MNPEGGIDVIEAQVPLADVAIAGALFASKENYDLLRKQRTMSNLNRWEFRTIEQKGG